MKSVQSTKQADCNSRLENLAVNYYILLQRGYICNKPISNRSTDSVWTASEHCYICYPTPCRVYSNAPRTIASVMLANGISRERTCSLIDYKKRVLDNDGSCHAESVC